MMRPVARWAAPVVVVAATLIAFLPVLSNGFIDWDDQANFVNNAAFRGFGWAQLTWMATTFHLGVYQPLAWLAVSVEFAIGGLDPRVYHAGSWLFHAATAGLVYAIAVVLLTPMSSSLNRVRICAAATALFFAVHPLRVEPVAWASAQGYPLAGIFAVGSIAAYLHAHAGWSDQDRAGGHPMRLQGRWMVVSLILALLAYLAKPIAITLPAILVLLDWHPLRRLGHPWRREVWMEKLPYAIPAALVAVAAPLARAHSGFLEGDHYGILVRIGRAAYGFMFYLWKTIAPFDLAFYYPLPLDVNPFQPRFLFSLGAVLILAVIVWLSRRRSPGFAVGVLAYAVLLSPVLGLVPQGGITAADHYAYFAAIPIALLFGTGLVKAWTLAESAPWRVLAGGGILLTSLVGLGSLTWHQTTFWKDAGMLWSHATTVDPAAFQPHNNLGLYFLEHREYDAALREFETTIRLNPSSAKAHFNRGLALARQGRPDAAIESYQRGLVLRPNDPTAWAHVGELLAGDGRYPEAESSYRRAVALAPHPDLFNSLGIVLAEQGRVDEAVAAFREALARDPGHDDARANLEMALQLRATQ